MLEHVPNVQRLEGLSQIRKKGTKNQTQAMFKTIVRGAWPDKIGRSHLFDMSQPLELPPTESSTRFSGGQILYVRVNENGKPVANFDYGESAVYHARATTTHSGRGWDPSYVEGPPYLYVDLACRLSVDQALTQLDWAGNRKETLSKLATKGAKHVKCHLDA